METHSMISYGALTIGTRDGATVEMAEEVGEENMFLFGLTATQVEQTRGWYNPRWHYDKDSETRAALDLIASGYFNPGEPGVFDPILDVLLKGDFNLHLADLRSYSEAHDRLGQFYRKRGAWSRSALLNVASSGMFSSDRTIAQYAVELECSRVPDNGGRESRGRRYITQRPMVPPGIRLIVANRLKC
jgi:glycogen phosphorylase